MLSSLGQVVTFTQNSIALKIAFTSILPIRFVQGDESIFRLLTLLGLLSESTLSWYIIGMTFPYLPELQGLKNYYILTRVLSQGSNGLFTG